MSDGWRGRFYEDFEVGDVYRCPLGRTITEADNIWFTLLTMNTNQLHFNDDYAARTEFRRPLVSSGVTVAMVLGMSVSDTSQNAVANLGWDQIRLPHPLYVGDTIYVESLVLGKRTSKSREEAGIVEFRTRGVNQDGAVCVEYERTILVYRRGMSPVDDLFPVVDPPITEGDR